VLISYNTHYNRRKINTLIVAGSRIYYKLKIWDLQKTGHLILERIIVYQFLKEKI